MPMEDADWLSAVIPATRLQGPHCRYSYRGHWRGRESYQLLSGPVERGDVRAQTQHDTGPGLNTGKATVRPELLEQG